MKSSKKADPKANKTSTASAAANVAADKSNAAKDSSGTELESAPDAITLIKSDHRKVEELFAQFEGADEDDEKASLAKQICNELIIHAIIEEELMYPACREAGVEDDMLDEAQVEHDGAKVLITEIMTQSPGDDFFDAKVKVLSEYIKHHVGEEEEPEDGILAKAEKASIDMQDLGRRLQERKNELMQLAESDGLDFPTPRSLHPHPQHRNDQEETMDRYSRTPDRDERGRFVSEDDDDRGGRYGRSERDDHQRYGRERDERGRFMEDDDDRRRYRSRDDDDDYRSRSRYEDDDDRRGGRGRGWSGDPEGHAEAARKGWEERGSYRSRGRSEDDEEDYRSARYRDEDNGRSSRGGGRGWSGDPEGHAEAARKGWEERGGARSRGGYDDDDDDRRPGSRSGQGEGRGWYGDSRGHAEAARRGWDERQSSPSQSRGRSADDDRRSSRGHNQEGRHEGHGGWFGDSRGHAEAARRGWRGRE